MKTITLNGREYHITCNMLALVSYQRISGCNPLDIANASDEQKAMFDITMGWCMLPTKEQEEISIDEFSQSIDTVEKQMEFSKAIVEELNRYYHVEPGDADQTDRHEVDVEEEDDKQEGEPDKYEKNV